MTAAAKLLLLGIVSILFAGNLSGQAQKVSGPATSHFSNEMWLKDFHQLVAEMSSHYADLEWAVSYRHMNLPKLRQDTEESIRQSKDEQSAKRAIEGFLSAFGDGHLSVSWQSNQSSSETALEPLCSRLGFRDRTRIGIDFSTLVGFVDVPSDAAALFPGGIVSLPRGKVGTIRIGDFDEGGFPLACEAILKQLNLRTDSPCDRLCGEAIRVDAANYLTRAIVSRARQLSSLGASAIVVDVTRNDGGDDWNEAVARSLSRTPLTDERRAFINHPMWTNKLTRDLSVVEADLERHEEPTEILEQAAERLKHDITLSRQTCDLSSAFVDGSIRCSLVADGGLFWSGVYPYAKPGSFHKLQSRNLLFNPLQYDYEENAQNLPLYIAVDGHTWSSAERFAALLQDNTAAVVIGELTGGAGCGSVDGGIPTTLTHSQARVEMPNCVGFRKDGSNANDGITPDVLVPWAARDTPFLRASKFRAALIEAMYRKPSKHVRAQ